MHALVCAEIWIVRPNADVLKTVIRQVDVLREWQVRKACNIRTLLLLKHTEFGLCLSHIFTCAHFTVNLVCRVGKITIKVVVNLVYKVGKEGFGLICGHHL